jgi:carbonic anhydrase
MTKDNLMPVNCDADILPQYRQTPVGDLLGYQNLDWPFRSYEQAVLLIGMCMDHRKMLHVPDNFAYILRAGGANFRRIEFKVSFAVAIGGVRAMCLIGHDQCGMMHLSERRDAFVHGLVENAGWNADDAVKHFDKHTADFEISDPLEFVRSETQRLRLRYPKILVAPLFYLVDDGRLYQVRET